MIALLNALFDAQATAIASHGGEILKFIGDGLLAIFPIEHADKAATAARCALDAAMQAVEAARGLMHDPSLVDEPPLEIVVALHVGTAIYGNIGAADRLDFTVIGPAVNLVSRIEAVARRSTSRSSSVTISRAPMAGRCSRSAVMSFAGWRHRTICSRHRVRFPHLGRYRAICPMSIHYAMNSPLRRPGPKARGPLVTEDPVLAVAARRPAAAGCPSWFAHASRRASQR